MSENPNSPTASTGGGPAQSETTTGVVDQSLNPNSPYYLHPSENPGSVLVSPALNGTNFYNWSKVMRRALSSKNKIKFINGSLPPPPESDPRYESWERCNNTVVAWISRTLSPQIAQSTISIDNAAELWKDLQRRFTKENHFRMSDLLQQIHSMRQGDRDLSTFFTDMKIVWDELEFLRPTPSCTCTIPCTCSLSRSVINYKEKELVIYFLKGLNDSYQAVRSQILMMSPLPCVSDAFALVQQQERPLNGNLALDSTTIAAANTSYTWNQQNTKGGTQGRGTQNGNNNNPSQAGRGRGRGNNNNNTKQCPFCGRQYHTVDQCYFKHGFPPGYRPRSQQNSTNSATTEQTSSDQGSLSS